MLRANMRLPFAGLAVISCICALSMVSSAVADLSLYIGGVPAYPSMGFGIGDPIPPLGIHSDDRFLPWSGSVHSSRFHLTNGAAVPPAGPHPPNPVAGIEPDNPPYGYRMSSSDMPAGVQFTMDIEAPYYGGITLITLWDDASVFDVPADTLHIWAAGNPGIEWSQGIADAGGPYQLGPGEEVVFDATGSVFEYGDEGDPTHHTVSVADRGDLLTSFWSIGGINVAWGLTPTISYETLVGGLGLTPGTYDLTLDLHDLVYETGTATTTIEILPEPATFPVVALGALSVMRRRR